MKEVNREIGKLDSIDSIGLATIENARCPEHYELPIQYFCLTCNVHCFCSECALSSHSGCEVLTLKEAYNTVVNTYINKWISQISTKSENLQVSFKKVLEDKRDQWTLKLQDLINNSKQMHNKINDDLELIKNRMSEWVANNNKEIQNELETYTEEIDKIVQEYEEMIEKLRTERNNKNLTEILQFYNENCEYLRQIILGDTPRDVEYFVKNAPKHIRDRINISNNTFKEMTNKLTELQQNIRNCHAIEKY
uniref:B-box zinc finger containing protein, putative n=1 Tax=Theileria annulata TaxID=5874 RepID=A0A3B0MT14_THEAN